MIVTIEVLFQNWRVVMFEQRFSPHLRPLKNVVSANTARLLRNIADRFDPAFRSVKLSVVSCINECPVCPNGALTLIPLPGHEELAENIRTKITKGSISEQFKATPVNIVVPKFGKHANKEPFLELEKDKVGGYDCMVLTSGPGTYKMVVQLLLVLWYLVGRDAKRITVISGYCPWSRSDKDEGNFILAIAPLIIFLIGAICGQKLSKIISADLHASQLALSTMPGKVTELQMMRRVIKHLLKDAMKTGRRITFAAPDDSAEKRFKKIIAEVCKELGIPMPLVVVYKRRSDSTQSTVTYVIGDTDSIKGSIVVTFDDEAATVGSNLQLGRTMVETYGAVEVWAAVVHGVLCGPAIERLSDPNRRVKRIYITDTIPVHNREELQPLINDDTIQVIEWMDDIAWAVYMHHWNRNIRGVR
jgi:ribose-phosphate pyrophosphokinase